MLETQEHSREIAHTLGGRTALDRYIGAMDSSKAKKSHLLLLAMKEYLHQEHIRILSVGVGSAAVEKSIAQLFPNTEIVAADLSRVMLEKVRLMIESLHSDWDTTLPIEVGMILPVMANAEALPVAESSQDVVMTSALNHEVFSFLHDHQLDEGGKQYLTNLLSKVAVGGRYILRDFMQPAGPNERTRLQVGRAIVTGDKDHADAVPKEFVESFVDTFEGLSFDDVRAQIQELKNNGAWGMGSRLTLTRAQAFELLVHYSWARSPEEIHERYAYLPFDAYRQLLQDCATEGGMEFEIEETLVEENHGYQDHISGRLDLLDDNGKLQPLFPVMYGAILKRVR